MNEMYAYYMQKSQRKREFSSFSKFHISNFPLLIFFLFLYSCNV
jgi:hypothetical protein